MKHVICLLLALMSMSTLASAQISGPALLKKMGYPADAKLLVLHADDVGMSHSVNLASFEALQKGWVSSASIMVPCPWFNEAAEFARQHPNLDFGLHLTLTSEWDNYRWGPVSHSQVASLLDPQGYFPNDSGIVGKRANSAEVAQELRAQLDKARDAGVRFSHLDNHMGALSQNPELFATYLRTAREAKVPVSVSSENKAYPKEFAGYEYLPLPTYLGAGDDPDLLAGFRKTLSALPPGVYITIVHLGHDDVELRAIMQNNAGGAKARQQDFDLVSNPEFHKLLKENGVTLISWKEVARALDAGK